MPPPTPVLVEGYASPPSPREDQAFPALLLLGLWGGGYFKRGASLEVATRWRLSRRGHLSGELDPRTGWVPLLAPELRLRRSDIAHLAHFCPPFQTFWTNRTACDPEGRFTIASSGFVAATGRLLDARASRSEQAVAALELSRILDGVLNPERPQKKNPLRKDHSGSVKRLTLIAASVLQSAAGHWYPDALPALQRVADLRHAVVHGDAADELPLEDLWDMARCFLVAMFEWARVHGCRRELARELEEQNKAANAPVLMTVPESVLRTVRAICPPKAQSWAREARG